VLAEAMPQGQSKAAQKRGTPKPAGSLTWSHINRRLVSTAAAAVVLYPWFVPAEPFLPKDGGQVLEHLTSTVLDSGAHKLRELRRTLAADPRNLGLAAQYARKCIERSRSDADPRYLGRAEAALAPWWNTAEAPSEALVLRATIRQSQHDFTNALADLDLALAKEPRDAQAWLTRATILMVIGDYPAARHACIPLAQLAPGLIALTAAANLACLNGEANCGCALLRNMLASTQNTGTSEKVWALTALGEASARLGREVDANNAFRKALELEPHDAYVLCSYADLLLDLGRAQETIILLKDAIRSDGVLLRLALAESELKSKSDDLHDHINTLHDRFEAGHLRGDFVHLREEARFALHLLGAPAKALHLAEDNWRMQREPADARILIESALAARNCAAAEPALQFIKTNRLQDVRLQALANQLEKSSPR
jgi:tetratricopeptide (TPR) repeat protein